VADVEAELRKVVSLLPSAARLEQLSGPSGVPRPAVFGTENKWRPWKVEYSGRTAVLRRTDPVRFRMSGLDAEGALANVMWLHGVLRDLAASGFRAPAPIADLEGRSVAFLDGAAWELFTFVPGEPIGRSNAEIEASGALLARFHEAASRLPTREQRPGAMPVTECEPAHPRAREIRRQLLRELGEIGADSAQSIVIHGDATEANVIRDDGHYHLIDYAIAQIDCILADLGSALWRIGRDPLEGNAYEPSRVARFLKGYASVHPLTPNRARAAVLHMKGRGLQLQRRLELRGGRDDSIIERLRGVANRQVELIEAAVSTANG
jgi:hypothetical protein